MMVVSKMNVLARLTISFLALFVIATSVSVYAIVKLNEFNRSSTRMLALGEEMGDCKDRLSDALFSQILYEKKYMILRDEGLYSHFLSTGKEFAGQLDKAMSIADTVGSRELLASIGDQHAHYSVLVAKEAGHLKARQAYPAARYKAEKEKAVEGIIEELNNLGVYIEEETKGRIRGLVDAGTGALRVAVVMAALSLLFGILIAATVTRGITAPLSIMENKTKEIARGDFGNRLNIHSPPEIAELARAFDFMCERLTEMDKMKSDFFSLMAHELRTPLSSIRTGINLLEKNSDLWGAEKRQRVLFIVSEECARLIGLVNSLLDLSKMEAGVITFDFSPGDMTPLIEKAIAEIEPLTVAKGIRIELAAGDAVPPAVMDRERILQVLRNLLGNAVKFTPEGGRIRVSVGPATGGLEVSVTDSGPGVAREDREAIFDKYRQSSAGAHAKADGTGLGLAIAKHIVDAHGGRIWLESEPGRGSIFTFFLPA